MTEKLGKAASGTLGVLTAAMLTVSSVPAGYAADEKEQPTRTVMFYCMGGNLEESYGSAAGNLIQAMESEYNEDLSFIVLTGNTKEWTMPAEYLEGADSISGNVLQVWELRGKQDGEEHGTMKLLGGGDLFTESTKLYESETLTDFADYCCESYPSDLYDLILWGHGGGPAYGYGMDNGKKRMPLDGIDKALDSSALIKSGGRFEIIDFDCCLMSNAEIITTLCDHAENFVCAAETEYSVGQYYTGWLDAVKRDPDMSGYDIGRKIVDDFTDFYTDYEESTDLSTLSVISSDNFRSRLLPCLNRLADILVSEIRDKNADTGLYEYYDEIWSSRGAYNYSVGDYDLIDLGGFTEALGCIQNEKEGISQKQRSGLANKYTETASAIVSILSDDDNSGDDVIHCGSANAPEKAADHWNLRRADGSFTRTGSSSGLQTISGLSIFFPSFDSTSVCDYIDAMDSVTENMTEGPERTFLEKYMKTALYYSLVQCLNSAADGMAALGEYPGSYEELAEWLEESDYEALVNCLVSLGEFTSEDEAEKYLSDAADMIIKSLLSLNNITARQIRGGSGELLGYQLTSEGVSYSPIHRILCDMRLSTDPKGLGVNQYYMFRDYEFFMFEVYFPDGFDFFPAKSFWEAERSRYITDFYDSEDVLEERDYADSVRKWNIDTVPEPECAAVYDCDGNVHIGLIVYTNEDKTEAYIPIAVLVGLRETYLYYLYVEQTDDGWKILGLSENTAPEAERRYVPMDSITTDPDMPTLYSPAAYLTDAVYYRKQLLPSSKMVEIAVDKENWGITVSTDIPDGELRQFFRIANIFGSNTDISDIIAEADRAAEEGDFLTDIASAEITVAKAVCDGSEQHPAVTVTVGRTVLTEGTDFRVVYDGSIEAGEAQLMVIGTGKYTGTKTAAYKIEKAEETSSESDSEDESSSEPEDDSSFESEPTDDSTETSDRETDSALDPTSETDSSAPKKTDNTSNPATGSVSFIGIAVLAAAGLVTLRKRK